MPGHLGCPIHREAIRRWRMAVNRQEDTMMLGKQIVVMVATIFLSANTGLAQKIEQDAVVIVTQASYLSQPDDSTTLAKVLAQYGARRNAVETAGRYFVIKGLVESYEKKKEEIYSLATDEIETVVREEKWVPAGKSKRYVVQIESRIYPADLIQAEIQNKKLEIQQADDTLREELEPGIQPKLNPARDIAKAYRYFRTAHWRPASIYLDRLEGKYPHWSEIFMAEAIAFYALQEPLHMKKALETACSLENTKACEDLKTLKRVHNLNLVP